MRKYWVIVIIITTFCITGSIILWFTHFSSNWFSVSMIIFSILTIIFVSRGERWLEKKPKYEIMFRNGQSTIVDEEKAIWVLQSMRKWSDAPTQTKEFFVVTSDGDIPLFGVFVNEILYIEKIR